MKLRLNNRFYFNFVLMFFCMAAVLPAWGKKEKSPDAVCRVQVSGKVRLVGSSAVSEIVIAGSQLLPDRQEGDGLSAVIEWYVANDEKHKLNDLQHRTVTVEGDETVLELKFASGLPAGKRRELKNIRIIAIQ